MDLQLQRNKIPSWWGGITAGRHRGWRRKSSIRSSVKWKQKTDSKLEMVEGFKSVLLHLVNHDSLWVVY